MEGDAKIRLGHCDDEEDAEGGEDRGRRRYRKIIAFEKSHPTASYQISLLFSSGC